MMGGKVGWQVAVDLRATAAISGALWPLASERTRGAAGHARGLAGEIPMYHHILIPTDGSPLSGSAVEKGIALAKALGAKVTVLTVVEPFPVLRGLPQSYDAPDEYTRRAHAEAEASPRRGRAARQAGRGPV